MEGPFRFGSNRPIPLRKEMRNPRIPMLPIHVIFLLLLQLLPLFSAASPPCNRTCSNSTEAVPYPFGFSDGCPIRLNCSGGQVQLGDFRVSNISSEALLIHVPPDCNRSIRDAYTFFGPNYAMTARTGLLLRNCSSSGLPECQISTQMLTGRFYNISVCSNVTCAPADQKGKVLLPVSYLDEIRGCSYLYSSAVYTFGGERTVLPSFELSAVEMGWWLDGGCGVCAANATCVNVSGNGSHLGVRCVCQLGFVGDGFAGGNSCRQEAPKGCSPSKYMSGKCGRTNRGVLIGGGIVAAAALMASTGLLCKRIRQRSASSRTHRGIKYLFPEASCSVPFYTFKEIERATNGFSEKSRLGSGAYGTVYVGKLRNDELVAIKKLRQRDVDSIEQVMNEVKLVSSVNHPSLVRLLGFCIDKGEQILVYEYMSNGTLSQHLQREGSRVGLSWTIRLNIAADTANAIAHLHSAVYPPIYHRDIKSSNILLDCNFNAKVADFGLSRMIMTDSSHISTAPQGTPGYLDPQYHQNFHLSDKSDVYSFGVVLVEIITAMKVVDFNRVQSEVNLAALAIDRIGKGCVEQIIDPFLEPHCDARTLLSIHKVGELAFRCLAFHKDMRPSMMEVAEELEQIRTNGWAPMSDESMFMSASSAMGSPLSDVSGKSRGASRNRSLVTIRTMEEVRGDSPVSVQDPWLSGQSSPSSSSLLGNVTR